MKPPFFSQKVLDYFFSLTNDLDVPMGIESIFPFHHAETIRVMKVFFEKYYHDHDGRNFIFGINPGRFGSGITGIGFSDGVNLQKHCEIENSFDKRVEMSADFIFEVIEAYGGTKQFYHDFYITATSPIGFIKDGKNYNYYDDKNLENSIGDFILDSMVKQFAFGQRGGDIICIGKGKNLKYLEGLNLRHQLFNKIHTVPHPRWVMQYKRRDKLKYIDLYIRVLDKVANNLN